MSDTLGGVETYIYNLIKMIDKKKFTFDFLVIGQDNKSVFEKEINDILGNDKNHFYYSPNVYVISHTICRLIIITENTAVILLYTFGSHAVLYNNFVTN